MISILEFYFMELYNFIPIKLWLCVIAICLMLWEWWKKPHPHFPPGPKGIPVLGVTPWLGNYPHISLCKMSKTYGPIMSIRLGSNDAIILSDYDTIKQAFVDQSSAFNNRGAMRLFQQLSKKYGIIHQSYGDEFKAQKLFALHALKGPDGGTSKMRYVCEKEVGHFIEFLKQQKATPIDLTIPYYNFASNVIGVLVMGRRFNYEENYKMRGVASEIYQLFSDPYDSTMILLLVMFEDLRFIPPFSGANTRFVKRQTKIIEMLGKIIEEHKKDFNRNNIRDFIDAFLCQQSEESKKEKFNDKHLQFFARDLFLAGAETTSNSLSWIFLYLLNFPHYHKLVVQEVDKVMGSDGSPPKMMSDLPITCAFIHEVSRCCPITPLGIQHETASGAVLKNYYIPAKTRVLTNIWAAHHDASIWDEPHKFDPMRHIKDERFIRSPKIISFGIGPRVCLGQDLAQMEIFLFVSKLLQTFQISSGSKNLPSVGTGRMSISFSAQRYKVTARGRHATDQTIH